jgi:hypothetical protein
VSVVALDGTVRAVKGVLPQVLAARRASGSFSASSAVATKVNEGPITSSFMSNARMAISSATVALHITMTWRTPSSFASSRSNSCT